MALPGSLAPHARFRAEAYVLTPEEGGRHKPFFTNYRPQFYFQTSDIAGMITLPAEIDMVMPGDSTASWPRSWGKAPSPSPAPREREGRAACKVARALTRLILIRLA